MNQPESERRKLIVPRLRQSSWEGQARVVCRKLDNKIESADVPWLAFGLDLPHTIEFIDRQRLPELGFSEAELEQIALENLTNMPAEWEMLTLKFGEQDTLKVLSCNGGYYGSEHILDREFMIQGQRQFDSPLVAVGIPQTGMLLMIDGVQAPEKLAAFISLVSRQFHNSTEPAISPLVYGMVDGQINGQLRFADDQTSQTPQEPSSQQANIDIRKLVATHPETNLQKVVLIAGSPDKTSLVSALWYAIARTLNEHLPMDNFSGEVEVIMRTDMLEIADAQHVIDRVTERFTGLTADHMLETRSGVPISLVMRTDKDINSDSDT